MHDPNLPCIYCWGRSGDHTFSLEHIWPQALGGAFMPDLFKTDQVCTKCNSIAGLFVDGAFLKSWFLAVEKLTSSHRFLDKNRPMAVPLFYKGFAEDFPCGPDECCERWSGPTGEHIYHIHTKDNERWDTFAGGDMIRRNQDPGRAYMSLTSDQPYWVMTALLSFMARFEGASHRLLTQIDGIPLGPKLLNPYQQPISEIDRAEVDFILKQTKCKSTHVPIRIDFAERFLSKLAIGLAYKILGPGVMQTPYLAELRCDLWTIDFEKRQSLRTRGTSFWDQNFDGRTQNILHWPGAWVILLNAFREGFGYLVITPGGRQLGRWMADDHEGWLPEAGPAYGHGQVYIVVPQRQTVVGPIPLIEYSSFKAGIGRSAALEELKAMEVELSDLPPKR